MLFPPCRNIQIRHIELPAKQAVVQFSVLLSGLFPSEVCVERVLLELFPYIMVLEPRVESEVNGSSETVDVKVLERETVSVFAVVPVSCNSILKSACLSYERKLISAIDIVSLTSHQIPIPQILLIKVQAFCR